MLDRGKSAAKNISTSPGPMLKRAQNKHSSIYNWICIEDFRELYYVNTQCMFIYYAVTTYKLESSVEFNSALVHLLSDQQSLNRSLYVFISLINGALNY